MRKPIKIELTLLNVDIVLHGLTLLWIFLIRLVLHISIPSSFEVLKPNLNQISHSIHWSIFWADYHDFSAEKWLESLKDEKWIYNSKITPDIDLKLVSFSAQCIIFFLKQRHEANELKICRTAFNFVSWDLHQTISNFQIGSTEIRCKLSLLSKIIEPNSIVDILTE